jgi:cytidyltransferase-like protein
MRYCFDLDNTICETPFDKKYQNCEIIEKAKNIINNLYDNGHYIIINTARGASSGIDWTDLTKNQLQEWGVKYHELITNKKPNADLFIDDKNLSIQEWYSSHSDLTGFIAGAFDILHYGYIELFKFAKNHCDKLIVALHEDPSIERSEKTSPIHSLEERQNILESIKYIDKIITYKTESELNSLLKKLNPKIRILDESYQNKKITGKEFSEIIYHKRDHNYSYTYMKNKILGKDTVENKINEIILKLVERDIENIDQYPYLSKKQLLNDFLDIAINNISIQDGLILEFGVYKGRSINYLGKLLKNKIIYGFDSFEGLPDIWNHQNPKGKFSLNGELPKVKKNVKLIKGLFEDTLPGFIKNNNQKVALLHIDCDMYFSTKCVLENLKSQIVDGTVIIFDEIWKYPDFRNHEIKAFAEFLIDNNLKYECLKTLKNRYAKAIFIVKK